MQSVINYLKTKSKLDIIFYCINIALLLFLLWQVMNHIPSQIKNTNTQIKELRQEMQDNNKELQAKMDKILFYLIDEGKKPKKP